MAKKVADAVLNAALDVVAGCNVMQACDAEPAFWYEAVKHAAWVATNNYAINDFVLPTVPNGFCYEVTTDSGSSGATEPTWPTTVGNTVTDGGITWTCRAHAGLAQASMAGGDFTQADGDAGDGNGRKVTMAQKTDQAIYYSGSASHVALVKTSTRELQLVTTCTAQTLTNGNTVTFPAWKYQIADPT